MTSCILTTELKNGKRNEQDKLDKTQGEIAIKYAPDHLKLHFHLKLFIIDACVHKTVKHIRVVLPSQFGIGCDQLPLPKHRELFTFVVSLYPLLQSKLACELK